MTKQRLALAAGPLQLSARQESAAVSKAGPRNQASPTARVAMPIQRDTQREVAAAVRQYIYEWKGQPC